MEALARRVPSKRQVRPWAVPGVALLSAEIAGAAEHAAVQTPSIFSPASTPAADIASYAALVIAICAAIFVVVCGLTVFALVRFRARPGDEGREPPQQPSSSSTVCSSKKSKKSKKKKKSKKPRPGPRSIQP